MMVQDNIKKICKKYLDDPNIESVNFHLLNCGQFTIESLSEVVFHKSGVESLIDDLFVPYTGITMISRNVVAPYVPNYSGIYVTNVGHQVVNENNESLSNDVNLDSLTMSNGTIRQVYVISDSLNCSDTTSIIDAVSESVECRWGKFPKYQYVSGNVEAHIDLSVSPRIDNLAIWFGDVQGDDNLMETRSLEAFEKDYRLSSSILTGTYMKGCIILRKNK